MIIYQVRPRRVKAEQFFPSAELPKNVMQMGGSHWGTKSPKPITYSFVDVENHYTAQIFPGDWIVTNDLGERFVIRAAHFEYGYEKIEV